MSVSNEPITPRSVVKHAVQNWLNANRRLVFDFWLAWQLRKGNPPPAGFKPLCGKWR